MILGLLMPFIRRFKGTLRFNTLVLIAPPLPHPIRVEYYASDKPAVAYMFYTGRAYEYDPATGSLGPEVRTTQAGVTHRIGGWVAGRAYPVDSLWDKGFELVAYIKPGRPHVIEAFNRTGKYIWFDFMVWFAEFEREEWELAGRTYTLEELLDMYLSSIADAVLSRARPAVLTIP